MLATLAVIPAAIPSAALGKDSSVNSAEKLPTPVPSSWLEGLTPEQRAAYEGQKAFDAKAAPLNELAHMVNVVGRNERQDIFSGVELSEDITAVNVYLTDLGQAGAFKSAMLRHNRTLSFTSLVFRQGMNTRVAASAEAKKALENKNLPFKVYGASWTMDGSAIKIDVDDPAAATAYARATPAELETRVPLASGLFEVRVEQGRPWEGTTRANDSAPLYGGAAMGRAFGNPDWSECTTGIPVIDRNGRTWMTTAGHCVWDPPPAQTVDANGGNVWGQATIVNRSYDVAFINTSAAHYTWDGLDENGYTRWLEGWQYSSNNQEVCHLGYNSMVGLQRIPCRNKVLDSEYWYSLTQYPNIAIKGVRAVTLLHPQAAVGGDSGAPVVSFGNGDNRIVKGFQSAVGGNTATEMLYVDFQDISSAFNVNLP